MAQEYLSELAEQSLKDSHLLHTELLNITDEELDPSKAQEWAKRIAQVHLRYASLHHNIIFMVDGTDYCVYDADRWSSCLEEIAAGRWTRVRSELELEASEILEADDDEMQEIAANLSRIATFL